MDHVSCCRAQLRAAHQSWERVFLRTGMLEEQALSQSSSIISAIISCQQIRHPENTLVHWPQILLLRCFALTSDPIKKIHEDRSISNFQSQMPQPDYQDPFSFLSFSNLPATSKRPRKFALFFVTINSEKAKVKKEMAFRPQTHCDGQTSSIYLSHV